MSSDLTALDATKPDGATETVSVLDDYLRETRLALKDWAGVEHDLKGRHKFPHGNRASRPATVLGDGVLYLNTEDRRIEWYDNSITKWLATLFHIGRDIVTTKGDILAVQRFVPAGAATFNIASGTRVVTAAGSAFTSQLKPGDSITLDTLGAPQSFVIEGITSDTELVTTLPAGSSIINKDAVVLGLIRMPVGSDGQGLVADSTQATGLRYAAQSIRGYREFGFKYGSGPTGFASVNDVCMYRRLLLDNTLAMEMEIGGTIYRSTIDITLSLPTNLPAAFVLTGGATFATTVNSDVVTATGSAFLTELKQGDTAIVDPAGGTPQKFTVKTIQSNTQFTALQVAANTLASKSAQRGGNTAVGRVPSAIYFIYVPPAAQFAGAYLDTATPVNGYHPRNVTDRWAGPMIYNGSGNQLAPAMEDSGGTFAEQWIWGDGWQEIILRGSSGGDYTTTSNGTYVAVDSTSFFRPLWIPAGVEVEVELRASLKNTVAGNSTLLTLFASIALGTAPAAVTAGLFSFSSKGGTVYASAGLKQRVQTRVPANGMRENYLMYNLFFQTVGAGTASISNTVSTDIATNTAGQGVAQPTIIIRFRTP